MQNIWLSESNGLLSAYELMIKANHYLIRGGKLTDAQKAKIVHALFAAKAAPQRLDLGVKCSGNADNIGRRMYPMFFVPPDHDGKKYQTVLGQTPKTQIFSANMYELEMLRLLYLLQPQNQEVQDMVSQTLSRLKTTCFGNEDDGVGECFDASLVVLRFLAAVAPDETAWLRSRIDNYKRHEKDKKRPWFSKWYYWLCLSELPFDIAQPEIDPYKPEMLNWLTYKSCVMNSEQDKTIHPVLLCMLRNCLSRYREYEYIKERQPYIKDKDGRLYFEMSI